MSRRIRIDPPGGVHHVMNRGVNRSTIFFDDASRLEFGSQLQVVHDRFGADVLAYCLMRNHYHLLLRTEPGTLSRTMQHLSSRFTRNTNDRLDRDGPIFRGRFHAIPVTTDAYLLAAFRYIHRNPLDLPGIGSIADYRWSSYRTYLGLRTPPPFVDPTMLRDMLGGPASMMAFHDRAGFGDIVAASTDSRVETLRSLVDLAISVDDLSRPEELPIPNRLDRTVLRLIDRPDDFPASVVDAAHGGSTTADARQLAVKRAEQRRLTEPRVDAVLALIDTWMSEQRRAA